MPREAAARAVFMGIAISMGVYMYVLASVRPPCDGPVEATKDSILEGKRGMLGSTRPVPPDLKVATTC